MYRLGVRTLILLFVNFRKKNLDSWQRQAADERTSQSFLNYRSALGDEGLCDCVAVSDYPGLISLEKRKIGETHVLCKLPRTRLPQGWTRYGSCWTLCRASRLVREVGLVL